MALNGTKAHLDKSAFLLMDLEFTQGRIKATVADFDLSQPGIQFGPGVFVIFMHHWCRSINLRPERVAISPANDCYIVQEFPLRNKKHLFVSLIVERNENMRGDTIIVEAHHRQAAEVIVPHILPEIEVSSGKYTITVAGESGSGKSETATAIADALSEHGILSVIFQQDDYFVYPPKTNDATRRKDISWVGTQEVRLDLLDEHLQSFRDGTDSLEKPLVEYEADTITVEDMALGQARVAIAEGTYTTALENVDIHIFIDRSFEETRAHREKRNRDASELDSFTEGVLKIEHDIISAQKPRAKIIIGADYGVSIAD